MGMPLLLCYGDVVLWRWVLWRWVLAMQDDVIVNGVVVPGYRVASGTTDSSPYPKGTIELQAPFFKALGLDLTPYFPGTLNISISPHTFVMHTPSYTFKNVQWIKGYPAEDFSFSPCQIVFDSSTYESLIYYPHPETKIGHFQNDSLMEVIAPLIAGLKYGDRVAIAVNPAEVVLVQ